MPVISAAGFPNVTVDENVTTTAKPEELISTETAIDVNSDPSPMIPPNSSINETVGPTVEAMLAYHDVNIVGLVMGYFIAIIAPLSNSLMTIVTRQAVFLGEERAILFMVWHGYGLLFIVGLGKEDFTLLPCHFDQMCHDTLHINYLICLKY